MSVDELRCQESVLSRIQGVVIDREGVTLRSGYGRYEILVVDSCVGVVDKGNDKSFISFDSPR